MCYYLLTVLLVVKGGTSSTPQESKVPEPAAT